MNALFGINRFVLSTQEYKAVLLTSQLSLVTVLALGVYNVMDVVFGYDYPVPFNYGAMLMAIVVILLNRKGYFVAGRILLTVTVEAVALFFTAVLPVELGVYVFSIAIHVGMLAVYGFKRIGLAVGLLFVSFVGFYLAAFYSPWRIVYEGYSEEYVHLNLKFSFVLATVAVLMIVYYLIKVSTQVEDNLAAKDLALRERNHALLEANASLDKFFYSVSHDLRAPLTSMLGLIQLIEMSQKPEEIKEYAMMLRGRAENLDTFIRRIGDYSRNAVQEVRVESVNLNALIRENLENFRFYPDASRMQLMVDIPEDVVIQSDPARLQEVFGNLLSNAYKYADPKKTNPFIKVKHRLDDAAIFIMIEDNGIGIRSEDTGKVFDMFFRADRSMDGTGLGLYIVRETLSKLGGSIYLNSVLGEGTTFTVRLPRSRSEADHFGV